MLQIKRIGIAKNSLFGESKFSSLYNCKCILIFLNDANDNNSDDKIFLNMVAVM